MKNKKKQVSTTEQLVMEGLKHLSEREINKLIKEEPDITIKEYLAFLYEISEIEKSIEYARQ